MSIFTSIGLYMVSFKEYIVPLMDSDTRACGREIYIMCMYPLLWLCLVRHVCCVGSDVDECVVVVFYVV